MLTQIHARVTPNRPVSNTYTTTRMAFAPTDYSPRAALTLSAFDGVDWTGFDNDDELDIADTILDATSQQGRFVRPAMLLSQGRDAAQLNIVHSTLPYRTYSRARSLSTTEWNRCRHTILQLYINDDRQLKDVRRIMRDQHDFDATEQMYKKKFRSWKIRKNYSQRQKEDILALQQSGGNSTGNLVEGITTQIIVNFKPVKQHRLDRHLRQKNRARNRRGECRVSYFLPEHSPELRAVETILLQTRYYTDWCCSQTDVEGRLMLGKAELDFFDCIWQGRRFLGADQRRAFAYFNKACSDFPIILQTMGTLSILDFIRILGNADWWGIDHAVRDHLLDYLCAKARQVLATLHPMLMILPMLKTQKISFDNLMLQLGRSITDGVSQSNFDLNEDVLLVFKINVVDLAYQDHDLAAAELEHKVVEMEEHLPPTQSSLIYAKYLLGRCRNRSGEYAVAERQFLEVIEVTVVATGQQIGIPVAVQSCYELGQLYEEKGMTEKAEQYFRLAVDGALHRWGEDDSYTDRYLRKLERFLIAIEKYEDAEMLRQEYAAVYSGLDSYYLVGTVEDDDEEEEEEQEED